MNKKFTEIQLILFLLLSATLFAQESSFNIGGYVKNLSSYQRGNFAGFSSRAGHFQNTLQTRLNMTWYASPAFTIALQSRHLLVWQKNTKHSNSFFNLFSTNHYYFNLNKKWINANDMQATSEIDRIYLDWSWNNLEVTLGRQRIAWGTCLVWNPTDLFNPFHILDFDYEEKPGTDALHMQYYLGSLSQLDFAITPGKASGDVIYAARFFFNYRKYDFNLIGGWQRNSLRLGGSWSGQLFDGGFRGEVVYSRPHITYFLPQPPSFVLSPKHIKQPYWTIALSYDYTFSNSFYWHTEYLYNELGTTGNAAARQFETLITGELSPARHSLFQEFAYDLTPLWRTDLFIIFNPTDHSWIAGPSLQYSVSDNWTLYLLAFPSKGIKNSEFGTLPSWYFVRFKFSF